MLRRPPSAVRRPRSAFYPSAFYLHPGRENLASLTCCEVDEFVKVAGRIAYCYTTLHIRTRTN
jgi:hypothetical protein